MSKWRSLSDNVFKFEVQVVFSTPPLSLHPSLFLPVSPLSSSLLFSMRQKFFSFTIHPLRGMRLMQRNRLERPCLVQIGCKACHCRVRDRFLIVNVKLFRYTYLLSNTMTALEEWLKCSPPKQNSQSIPRATEPPVCNTLLHQPTPSHQYATPSYTNSHQPASSYQVTATYANPHQATGMQHPFTSTHTKPPVSNTLLHQPTPSH